MNFGSVSLKLAVSSLLLSGCAVASEGELYSLYKQYENKVGSCLESARQGTKSFPQSKWLSSLDESKQKKVLLYLSSSIMDSCSYEEKNQFKLVLSKESQDVQKILSEWLELKRPKAEKPLGIDDKALGELESQISSPFHAFAVFNQIKRK